MNATINDTQAPGLRAGERFFFFYALFLFAIVVIGFPAHALINGLSFSDAPLLLHVHAVTMGGWFGLLVLQTGLIGASKVSVHKALGLISLLLVPAMIAAGLLVSAENMDRTGNPLIFRVNLVNAGCFTLFYLIALLQRSTPDWHKRFMMFGSVCLMPPALARWSYAFGIPEAATILVLIALPLIIVIYDLVRRKRPTVPGLVGLAGFAAYIAALFTVVANSPPL